MKLLAYLALAGGVALAACSPITPKNNADGGDTPDANTIDGGDTPDAGPGMVTARALDRDGNPIPGVNVAFSNPDGTLISMATTAAPGEVSATVPSDAIVSFGYSTIVGKSSTGTYMVQVIHGVQPGDTVEAILGGIFGGGGDEHLGSATMMFPSLHAGTSYYTVGTKCYSTSVSSTQMTFTTDFYSNRCSGRATTLDLLGIAWNNSNAPLAWTMFDDVQIGAATTFTSSGWNTNFAQFNAFYTNAPYAGTIELRVGLIRDSIDYAFGGYDDDFDLAAGANAAYIVPVPAAFTQVLSVGAQHMSAERDKLILHQTNLMPTTNSNSVDLTGLGFPSISGVALDTAMPGRPAYRWTVDGTIPATTDALIAFSIWSDVSGQWVLAQLAPSSATSPLRVPSLPNTFLADPTTLSPRWPPPAAVTPFQNLVGLYESGDHSDYEAMRQQRGLAGLLGEGQFLSPTAPIGSRSVVSVGGQFSAN